jgi:hypothetical protein
MGPPERLYKYQPFNAKTLANLTRNTLWFASPLEFNDPLDCCLYVVDEEITADEAERLFQHYRGRAQDTTAFDESYRTDGRLNDDFIDHVRSGRLGRVNDILKELRGVACFASSADNQLMWAHYADGHRGFCLEFNASDEPFSNAQQVIYSEEAPRLKPAHLLSESEDDDMLRATLLTKSHQWSYEGEWRLIHATPRTGRRYDAPQLTGLYFGAAMSPAHREILRRILRDTDTQLYEMSVERGTFGLSITPDREVGAYRPN